MIEHGRQRCLSISLRRISLYERNIAKIRSCGNNFKSVRDQNCQLLLMRNAGKLYFQEMHQTSIVKTARSHGKTFESPHFVSYMHSFLAFTPLSSIFPTQALYSLSSTYCDYIDVHIHTYGLSLLVMVGLYSEDLMCVSLGL